MTEGEEPTPSVPAQSAPTEAGPTEAPPAEVKHEDKAEDAAVESKPSTVANIGNELQKSISNTNKGTEESANPQVSEVAHDTEDVQGGEDKLENTDGKGSEVAEKSEHVDVREEAPAVATDDEANETSTHEAHNDAQLNTPSAVLSKHSKLSMRSRSNVSKRSYIFKKSLSKISHMGKHTAPKDVKSAEKEKDINASTKDDESIPIVPPSGTEIENEEHKMHDEMLKKYAGVENVETAKNKMKELLNRGSNITNIDSMPTHSMSMVSHSVAPGTEKGAKKETAENPDKVLSPDLVKENSESHDEQDEQNDDAQSVKSKRSTKSGLFNIFLNDASKGSKVSALSKQSSLEESQDGTAKALLHSNQDGNAKALLNADHKADEVNASKKREKDSDENLSKKMKDKKKSGRHEDDLSAKRAALKALKGIKTRESSRSEEEEEEDDEREQEEPTSKETSVEAPVGKENVKEPIDEGENENRETKNSSRQGTAAAAVAIAAAVPAGMAGAKYMNQSGTATGEDEQGQSLAASSRQLATYAEDFLMKSSERLKEAIYPENEGKGEATTNNRDLQMAEEVPSSPLDLVSEWFGTNTSTQRTWFDDNLPTTCEESQATLENAQSTMADAFTRGATYLAPASLMLMRLFSPETCQRQANRCQQPANADENIFSKSEALTERSRSSSKKNSSKATSGNRKESSAIKEDVTPSSDDSTNFDRQRSRQGDAADLESLDTTKLEKAILAGEESLKNLDQAIEKEESRTAPEVNERDTGDDERASPPPASPPSARTRSSKFLGTTMNADRQEAMLPPPSRRVSKGAAVFERHATPEPVVVSKDQKKQKATKQKKPKKEKAPKKQKAAKERSLSPKRGGRDTSPTRSAKGGKSGVVRQGLTKKKRIFG